jgi:hypothetical protein
MKTPDLFAERRFLNERPNNDIPAETLDGIRRSNEEILARYPASAMKLAVAEKLARAKQENTAGNQSAEQKTARTKSRRFVHRSPAAWRYAAGAMAACCVVAVAALAFSRGALAGFMPGADGGISATGEIRTKGVLGPQIFVYKKDGNSAVLLDNGATVLPDDIVQVSYIAGGDKFGAIISVDGNGVVTQHYPDFGDVTVRLVPTGEVSLDFAYRLDNAPGFERFFFVSGSMPFSTTFFKEALSSAAKKSPDGKFAIPDELSPKAHETDILLLK